MSGNETFYYNFQDGTQEDTIVVNVSTPATDSTGYGPGCSIHGISGSFRGQNITGEVGSGGSEQTDTNNRFGFNNTVFPSASDGRGLGGSINSVYGIDVSGLEFRTFSGEYNIFTSFGNFYLQPENTASSAAKDS